MSIIANINQLYPDAALLRSFEGGITPVKPSLAHTEMGMAFWSFAGSKVTNLNLYWRSKVRRGHTTAPSPSPNFVQAFHQGGYLCSCYSRTPDEHICCYSN